MSSAGAYTGLLGGALHRLAAGQHPVHLSWATQARFLLIKRCAAGRSSLHSLIVPVFIRPHSHGLVHGGSLPPDFAD
jgi:hypothetical protein